MLAARRVLEGIRCFDIAVPQLLRRTAAILFALASVKLTTTLHAQTDVTTNRYDGGRSGATLTETTLTTGNVNVQQFGKLYSYPVDGAVYAQPLYVSGLTIGGGIHNVLYVATMNDKVYAFDADTASPTPLWTANFTSPPSVTAVPINDIVASDGNILGNVGIEGTPVISRTAGTLYLVARTKEDGAYVQRLHALDITTGLERPGSPVMITASAPGSAPDATAGTNGQLVVFNPRMQQQRSAVALSNGVVLVAWGGHQDVPPYHGWIMGFDATTLARVGVFLVSPDVYEGGIWQGGRAPTLDAAGNAYFATGNGVWDGVRNWGDSLLKFSVSRSGLALVDYFTPGNETTLDINDSDLSGSGFTLLPGTDLLFGGGKEGVLYLLDARNLGHKVVGDTQVIQRIAANGGHVMGGPVFWNSPSAGPLVYNWAEEDVLVAYRLSGGRLTPPYAQGQVRSPGHPGGSLTISANGSAAGTGIVWALMPTSQSAKHILAAGILRAYNAETLQEIWTSEQNPTRDRAGTLVKFVPPLVANGRVYVATQDNSVNVYGLLPPDAVVRNADDIVLYAKDASPVVGNWRVVADGTAAAGVRIENPDRGVPKLTAPLAAPADYFEVPFMAKANTAYRIWIRARAQDDSYTNDSVYVQFSGSVSVTGDAVNRIGSTQAVTVSLEECTGCGEAAWGWQDNAYGLNALGPVMYFTDGWQRIRVQSREDGISIDQIVLSPVHYLTTSPGANKNDATILAASIGTKTIVGYPGIDAVPHGNWRVVPDSSAAGGFHIEQPDAGVAKIETPAANPANYIEMTFTAEANTPYRLWMRGRAQADAYTNDSVYVQFSGSVTATGAPIDRIQTTEATKWVLEDCTGCGVQGWGWQDNGYGMGVLGPLLYFTAGPQTIRIQGREDGISIDQIVLSPDAYLTTSPGSTKDDAAIVPRILRQ